MIWGEEGTDAGWYHLPPLELAPGHAYKAVGISARRMWFVLESLETMPEEALEAATAMLMEGLGALMPGCVVAVSWVGVMGNGG